MWTTLSHIKQNNRRLNNNNNRKIVIDTPYRTTFYNVQKAQIKLLRKWVKISSVVLSVECNSIVHGKSFKGIIIIKMYSHFIEVQTRTTKITICILFIRDPQNLGATWFYDIKNILSKKLFFYEFLWNIISDSE